MHELPLITTVAAGLTAAWALGLLTQRLGLSPIVGYLLAGVLLGPNTPGYVGDIDIAQQLAELGVILLMFGVGLHFHVDDLWAVRKIAVPGAIVQSLVATLVSVAAFGALGIPWNQGAVIGMAMAVASTVVLMRVLMDAGILASPAGHVAVGWLVVEDVFTVVLLVMIPVLGTTGNGAAAEAVTGASIGWTLALTLVKLAVLIAIVLLAGARVVPWVLVKVARLRSHELFTLTVLVFSIAIAAASYFFFGASMALGAFLAGMVVAQSPLSHQAAAEVLPMRDAFAVLFFVAVGMLFDPHILLEEPLMILTALAVILFAKPAAALAIVAVLGHPARTALVVAVGLAQIGEFSFILADLARRYQLMPEAGQSVLVAAAILSITINPILFRSLPAIEAWLQRHHWLWRLLNGRAEQRLAHINRVAAAATRNMASDGRRRAVVIGYGPVGRSVHRLLKEAGMSTVVIDLNMDTVSELNGSGQTAIYGDASHEGILEQAGVREASHVVLTLPHGADRAAIVAAVRVLSPKVRLFVRARYLGEREELERSGATAAVFEEAEAAVGLARLVLADTGVHREAAEQKLRDLRLQLIRDNMSNLRTQRVQSVMVPWSRVRRLLVSTTRQEVLAQVAHERFSRWPVVEAPSGRVAGYLLTKDLISQSVDDGDWQRLIRAVQTIRPDDDIESTLVRMQNEGVTLYVVSSSGSPEGLITFEDILEQVVGRIEDEYPHDVEISLCQAVQSGGVVLNVAASTPEEAITALAAAIPPGVLPPESDRQQMAERAVAREQSVSTDLGVGVAVPHARCTHLRSPIMVVGRSEVGIEFSPPPAEPVRLIFLLITPTEQPEVQLSLLSQLARIAGDQETRQRLLAAPGPNEITELLCQPSVNSPRT